MMQRIRMSPNDDEKGIDKQPAKDEAKEAGDMNCFQITPLVRGLAVVGCFHFRHMMQKSNWKRRASMVYCLSMQVVSIAAVGRMVVRTTSKKIDFSVHATYKVCYVIILSLQVYIETK